MLDTIVASVRNAINNRSRIEWEREIKEQLPHAGSRPSFSKAISAPGENFIFEIKRKSPSNGAPPMEVDVVSTAINYARFGTAAISVLTEPQYFGGSCNDLRLVSDVVEVPTIRKDFVIDPLQINEAAAYGASAVLLIVAILSDAQLIEFLRICTERQIDALVEVHDEAELDRAIAAGAQIIGVNSRNLKTMEIDLGVSESLLGKIPQNTIRIAESGIKSRGDVERLRNAGANAFLIGTSVMRAKNLGDKIRELRGL